MSLELLLLKLCRGGYVEEGKMLEMLKVLESSIMLPWCGALVGKCENLKKRNGLYTQCENECGSSLSLNCKVCESVISKNGGVSRFGRVSDRLKCGIMEYCDPSSGKKASSYMGYMKKMNITKSEVLAYGKIMGVSIPECHFEEEVVEEKKKRGRPKKEGEKGAVEEEKKKRGRPKKEKQVVSNRAGEELIASLLIESRVEINVDNKAESKVEVVLNTNLEVELKKEVDQEEAEPSADMADMDVESNAEPSADMADSDEEETVVIKFDIKGVTYLKSKDNVLYDMLSHDVVGLWNETTTEIEELPEEEDEEEE